MVSFLRALLSWLRPYRAKSLLLFVGLLASLSFDYVLPLSFKFLIDDAIVPREGGKLALILVVVAVAGIASSVVAVASDYLHAHLASNVVNDIRLNLFRHLQELPIAFYERTSPGDITARFSGDVAAVEHAVLTAAPAGLMDFVGLLVGVVMLFLLQWRLALLAVAGLPIAIVIPKLLSRRAQDASYELGEERGRIAGVVQENAGAQHVVKAFGLQPAVVQSFAHQLTSLRRAGVRANFLAWLLERAPNLSILVFHLAVLCVGSYLALDRTISIGSLVSFNAVLVNLSQGMYGMSYAIPELVRASAGYRRITDVLRELPESADASDAVVLPRLTREVAFRNVTFAYEANRFALKDASFTLPRGSFVALVGSSGSGKSTVIRMLLRFDEPTAGSIAFDDRDIAGATQDSVRAQIGVVFQDSVLFDATIRENIRCGRPGASDAEVEGAARAAEVHDFVSGLPDRYDTIVGERGGRLSGGQRQRIAIARALVRQPELLILDEATSALDPATEAAVTRTLNRLRSRHTIVSATHRLASVMEADQIIVMSDGRAVEQGRHTQLLELGGDYARLWEKQSGMTVSDSGSHAAVRPAKLAGIPILNQLGAKLLSEVVDMLGVSRFAAGEVAFRQGDPGDHFYLIARGVVEVVRDVDGVTTRVATLDDGDYFGETALLTDAPRDATVRTLTPALFLTLERSVFLDLLERRTGVREMLDPARRPLS